MLTAYLGMTKNSNGLMFVRCQIDDDREGFQTNIVMPVTHWLTSLNYECKCKCYQKNSFSLSQCLKTVSRLNYDNVLVLSFITFINLALKNCFILFCFVLRSWQSFYLLLKFDNLSTPFKLWLTTIDKLQAAIKKHLRQLMKNKCGNLNKE